MSEVKCFLSLVQQASLNVVIQLSFCLFQGKILPFCCIDQGLCYIRYQQQGLLKKKAVYQKQAQLPNNTFPDIKF